MHIHLRIGTLDTQVHLYVCTCRHVYFYVHVCISTHIHSYVCVDVYTLHVDVYGCVCMGAYMCAYTCAYTHADRCVYGSMHLRVPIYVNPHLCVYITRIHTCASVCVDMSALICMYVCMDTYVSAHMNVCIFACVYPCTSVHICLCLHIYTQAYTHSRNA